MCSRLSFCANSGYCAKPVKGENFQAEVFRRGNSHSIVVNVGYDDDLGKGYSLVLGLDPMAGGDLEYFFFLYEFGPGEGDGREYWCGLEIPENITKSDRECILQALLAATDELLTVVKPQRVQYCTHDRDPPEKATVKHHMVIQVFESCGYAVHTADPYHGKKLWWMERGAHPPVAPGKVQG